MVENRPLLNLLAHLMLIVGVVVIAFPVYIAIIASTHGPDDFMSGVVPLLPGPHAFENYWSMISAGVSSSGVPPIGRMLFNSLVMALSIAIGKIAISILSAYAIVYFRFPFRAAAFWTIFITLMLPVEVRIVPTFKVVADLHMLNSYAGLSIPLDRIGDGDLPVPPVLPDRAGRAPGGGAGRRRRAVQVLSRHPAPSVAHQHGGAVRHPLHLWLEPVSVAADGGHRRALLHHRHGHQAHGRRHRRHTRSGTS